MVNKFPLCNYIGLFWDCWKFENFILIFQKKNSLIIYPNNPIPKRTIFCIISYLCDVLLGISRISCIQSEEKYLEPNQKAKMLEYGVTMDQCYLYIIPIANFLLPFLFMWINYSKHLRYGAKISSYFCKLKEVFRKFAL